MIQNFLKVLKQYGKFKTRSTIKKFWLFHLFSFVIIIILIIIDSSDNFKILGNIGVLTTIYSIFIFIPSLSIIVRRLNDVGKSGWTILYILLTVIGSIWLFALFSRDTMPERNKWGGNPNLRGF